jgi:photosystem II stability/assembly factor-like uncharacterized protein
LNGVFFTRTNFGTVVGQGGTILRTTDGGTGWVPQTSGTTNDLRGVSFTDANTGTVVGHSGTILRTIDGGTAWVPQTSGTTNNLTGVSFTDANTGTVVGVDGIILRTTDGGITWEPQTSGTPQWLLGVSFPDINTGEAVGTGGANIRTTDGGKTWVQQTIGAAVLYDVSFTDANTGTVVGENGTILRMSTATGIQNNNPSELPQEFSLLQNYPNPFNPLTTISYSVPEIEFVTLKVYDVLGNKIATLINEEKPVGSYEIEFNVTNHPSGIYFYRLQAGTFVETKKMILLK